MNGAAVAGDFADVPVGDFTLSASYLGTSPGGGGNISAGFPPTWRLGKIVRYVVGAVIDRPFRLVSADVPSADTARILLKAPSGRELSSAVRKANLQMTEGECDTARFPPTLRLQIPHE